MTYLLIQFRVEKLRGEPYNALARQTIQQMPDDDFDNLPSSFRIGSKKNSFSALFPRIPALSPDAVVLVVCLLFVSSHRPCSAFPQRSDLPAETRLGRATRRHADS